MSANPISATEQAWLDARRDLLTASDVAAIMGLERVNKKTGQPYRTMADVFAAKTTGATVEQNEAMEWGNRLQSSIAKGFADRTGFAVREWPAHEVVCHASSPWFACTPDAQYQEAANGPWLPLEIKNVGEFSSREWESGAPIYYQVQLGAQIAVLDAPRGSIAALIGGRRLVHFPQERNAAFEAQMMAACGAFWTTVLEFRNQQNQETPR